MEFPEETVKKDLKVNVVIQVNEDLQVRIIRKKSVLRIFSI
jgi:hypothetical protein